jgi:hypothetical protein
MTRYEVVVLLEVLNRAWLHARKGGEEYLAKHGMGSGRWAAYLRQYADAADQVVTYRLLDRDLTVEEGDRLLSCLTSIGVTRVWLRSRVGDYYEELLTDTLAVEDLLGGRLSQQK